jgi:hypothetical protein
MMIPDQGQNEIRRQMSNIGIPEWNTMDPDVLPEDVDGPIEKLEPAVRKNLDQLSEEEDRHERAEPPPADPPSLNLERRSSH